MCYLTTNYLWPTAILAVITLMFVADVVDQKQVVVGRIDASDAGRSHVGKRRLRDLVLAGVNMNSVHSYEAIDNQRSVAESVERLLRLGYRYFELDVREHTRLFYWSTTSCNTFAQSMNVHEEISLALVALASFSQQFPSDVFVIRFALESQREHRAFSGSQLLATIFKHIGSRSALATRVFESTVDEVLFTQQNIVVMVKNLSSMMPSSVVDASLLSLRNIFVDANTVRNETDINAWNVVDQGGLVLEQHRSVDTLSVLVLNWQGPDATIASSFLSGVCHSSLLLLFVASVVVCWTATRLSASRCSLYKVYGGLATASATVTFLLALRMVSNNSPPTVADFHLVNNSCSAVVDAVRHWVARPVRYRLNIFVVDHRNYCCGCACNSSMAGLAALANAGRIRRQVTLTHAGSPLSDAVGLRAIFACPSVLFAYVVTSRDEGHVVAWNQLSDGDAVNFDESEFPMDATVAIYVATVWNRWLHVS